MNNDSKTLIGGETFAAWEVLKDVESHRIEVGGNLITNLLAKRRAEKLRGKIGHSLGALLSQGRQLIEAEFVLDDPKDQKLISTAVSKQITERDQFAERAGRSIVSNPYWIGRSRAVESLHVALNAGTD